jgi:hypothetical protein
MIGKTNALNKPGMEVTLTVNVTSGAIAMAKKGATTVSGVSTNGSVTLKMPEAGQWRVSALINDEHETETKIVNVVNSYTVYFATSPLDSNSWTVIRSIADANLGTSYWAIGDRKAVTLNGTVGKTGLFSNVTTYAFIIGFNHNSSYEGSGKIHFQFGKTEVTGGTDVCFVDKKAGSFVSETGYFSINSTSTNAGGWASSQIRSLLGTSLSSYSETFIGALPSDLRTVLKSTTKYTDNVANGTGNVSGSVTATSDYLFLLAEFELEGVQSIANTYEQAKQARYAYYSAGNSKKKYKHTATATSVSWWLRSPLSTSTSTFCIIIGDGSEGGGTTSHSTGIAPCFAV